MPGTHRVPGTGSKNKDPAVTASITWTQFVDATARIRQANNDLARLIADTLSAQFGGAAAYLVLHEAESADFMGLISVLDAEGSCLFAFGDDLATLPPLPPDSPHASAWDGRDPAEPWTVCRAVQGLYQTGALFDRLPLDRLPQAIPSTACDEHSCLLLSTAARPDLWTFDEADMARLVRPYSSPRPSASPPVPLPTPPASR
ncbi:hypothetical protein [Streptomyces sp. NPDC127038]|uniref:hypothetical protein n=1 Tax=Streptomyces sp. NPDC127038 TaxID=3347114 RepID=UPI0036647944